MIDSGDTPKPQETRLNAEQTAKVDADLETFSSISNLAQASGSILEITGGYAVEALLDGKITRPHGDMDAVIWLAGPNLETPMQDEVESLLRQQNTIWGNRINEKNRDHFMELRENAPALQFEERRRIELYTFPSPSSRPLIKKYLIDSQGQKHEVHVTTFEEIVADKVRIFNRTSEEKINKRDTNQTDIDDFKRLINHKEFSKEKYLETMSGYLVYRSDGGLSIEDALAKAEEQLQKAIQITTA